MLTIFNLPFNNPNNLTEDKAGVGGNNNWVVNGACRIVKDNVKGYCLECPGKDGYLKNTKTINLGNANYTLEMDIYPYKISGCQCPYGASGTNEGIILQLNFYDATNGWTNFNGFLTFKNNYNVSNNTWHHILLKRENNKVYLYFNNIQVSDVTTNYSTTINNFIIASDHSTCGVGFYGKIANFKFMAEKEDLIENNKFDTKRNIYRLYNISYDSLYNYNINDYSLYDDTSRNIHNNVLYNNDTLRDINKLNTYNNDIYRSILKDYIYNNNIYRSILRNYVYNTDTSRNIHNKLLYNNDTYRDIHKINIYNNDIYRSILKDYVYNNNIYRSILKDYIYNNDTYRDINKINNYNNNTLRNVLYNINPLYNDTYRYIKRINKPLYDTKRNIKHDYMDILYNTKRLIHNNINIINYVHRKKVRNGNINNDTVRSVISWKHKIVTFVTNPRYKLK